jgi:hypothetical protein
MDYADFERKALGTGVLVRAHTTTKNTTLVVADTNLAQPLAQATVTTPILEALAKAGPLGAIHWRVERLGNGTKRIHASAAIVRERTVDGWDAVQAA